MTLNLTWTTEDIIRATHGQCVHEQSWAAHGVSIDSRTLKPGDLFIALQGPTHDGHDHVASALAAGAIGAIVAKQPPQTSPQTHLIFVADTFKALEDLGHAGRSCSAAAIVAVTGSVGKTGTKEMLRLMLSSTGPTHASEGSLNNHWGVPLTLARLPAEARYGVIEMGMNHAGELGPLSKQVRPHVALITTIEAVHMEHFDSVEAIADAKAEIFQGMKTDGAAVLNRDNGQFARLAAAAKAQDIKKILSFGRESKCDARLLEWSATTEGSRIVAEVMGRKLTYILGASGEHLILNSLGALLACSTAGSDVDACAAVLAHYNAPKGRGTIESIALPDGKLTLIDESYNASPVSIRSAIKVLAQTPVKPGGRRILVLGDMKELGETSSQLHRALLADITDAKIDSVFCCGEMMQNLFDAISDAMRGGYAKDSLSLMPLVLHAVRSGDIVSVKGSHSMQMERIVQALRKLGLNNATKKPLFKRL